MIYVGTCGFSYKDWIGPFYPGKTKSPEMLPYYANAFRAVEIDSSFYGVLRPETIARMDEATPQNFRFCFKAPQTITHPPDVTARMHPDAQAFVDSVLPLVEHGKFGAALMQFPNAFKPVDSGQAYLKRLIAALEPLALVAEFRNREWQTPRTHELLAELGVGWCNVDMPRYESLLLPSSDVTSGPGYVRFHGRNAQTWWTGDNTTRYDYRYTEDELVPWADRVAEIEEEAGTTYAFFNNHARGNAVRNAEMFVDLLRERCGDAADAIVPKRGDRPEQGTLFG